jgi:redox-sensitive bicupin YhaK (pirin superfamily)
VRRIVAVVALVVVTVAILALGYRHVNPSAEVRARKAIEFAERTRGQFIDDVESQADREAVQQSDQELESAREAFSYQRWPEAEKWATTAGERLAAMLERRQDQTEGVGHFYTIDGRVQVQRTGEAEWENAHLRMPIFNGDFVKTGRDGSAEILFVDGSLYRIGQNSLLEIQHRPSGNASTGTVRMVVGRINVYTSDEPSIVSTNHADAEIQRKSKVAVDVAEDDNQTMVSAYEGSARVRNSTGSEVWVGGREQVSAGADGTFSEKRKIPEPPLPIEPHNNAGFEMSRNRVIHLKWRRSVPGSSVHLQVSRSQRFLDEQTDVDTENLNKDSVRLQMVSPATYFWRVATLDEHKVKSEWSAVRRFRIYSSSRKSLLQDQTPPALEVSPPQQLGHLFIVRGSTEVGASVTINGEIVELDSDGKFSKTVELAKDGWNDLVIASVDPSGNRTERRERVFVEGVY